MKVEGALAGLDGEVGNIVADADKALLRQLLLRFGKDGFRPLVLELEGPLPRLVNVRQQGLVFVVEYHDGAPLDGSGKHQLAVRLADQRQVEAE